MPSGGMQNRLTSGHLGGSPLSDENPYSSNIQTSQANAPWGPIQEPLLRGVQQAESQVLNQPLEFFPGDTFTPFSPETALSLAAATGRAFQGNPLNQSAQQQTMDTLEGGYLGQGPGWDRITDAVTSSVLPGVDSQFGVSGRFGSPLHAEAVARGTSRGLAPFLDAERNRMMGASALAPQLAREDYYDIDRLGGVGMRQEDLYSRALQDQIARWDFAQNEPYSRISRYMNLINPSLAFNQSTGQTTYNPNVPLTTMGLGMQAGSTFGPLMMMSSKAWKTDNEPVSVLKALDDVPVESWRYLWGYDRHIGPYAEDFQKAFGVGDGSMIAFQDMLGVCLAAIKELSQENKDLRAEIEEMKDA